MPLEDNVPGRFYIDSGCIKCDECLKVAPKFFKRGETQNYVSQQPDPTSYSEVDIFTDAYERCPVSALRDRLNDQEGFRLILSTQNTTKKG